MRNSRVSPVFLVVVLHGFTWEYYSVPTVTIDTPSTQDNQVTFRGSEMGNALAITFGASAGLVGRNIYVPLYQYMPLPQKIDDAVYCSRIAYLGLKPAWSGSFTSEPPGGHNSIRDRPLAT